MNDNMIWLEVRNDGLMAQVASRSPPTTRVPSSRLSHSMGFVVDSTGSVYVFIGVSPVLPYHKFHSTISPHSFHVLVSSVPVMVRQVWWAGSLLFRDLQCRDLITSNLSTWLCFGDELRNGEGIEKGRVLVE